MRLRRCAKARPSSAVVERQLPGARGRAGRHQFTCRARPRRPDAGGGPADLPTSRVASGMGVLAGRPNLSPRPGRVRGHGARSRNADRYSRRGSWARLLPVTADLLSGSPGPRPPSPPRTWARPWVAGLGRIHPVLRVDPRASLRVRLGRRVAGLLAPDAHHRLLRRAGGTGHPDDIVEPPATGRGGLAWAASTRRARGRSVRYPHRRESVGRRHPR